MKKALIFLLLFALLLTGCAARESTSEVPASVEKPVRTSTHIDTRYRMTFQNLMERSTQIFEGTVLSCTDTPEEGTSLYTAVLQVDRVLKGDCAEGDTVLIRTGDLTRLPVGKQRLVFARGAQPTSNSDTMRCDLVNITYPHGTDNVAAPDIFGVFGYFTPYDELIRYIETFDEEDPDEPDFVRWKDGAVKICIQEKPRGEYILEEAEALLLLDIFYSTVNYEKEVLPSPIDSKWSMKFVIGDDYLGTAQGEECLDGRIDGERVIVRIGPDEAELLSGFFYKYQAMG